MTLYTLNTGHLYKAQEMQNVSWGEKKNKMQYWMQTFSLEKKHNSGILHLFISIHRNDLNRSNLKVK